MLNLQGGENIDDPFSPNKHFHGKKAFEFVPCDFEVT